VSDRPASALPSKLLAGILETTVNRYLALSSESAHQLAALDGKVIALEIRGLGQTLYLTPGAAGLQVHATWSGPVDTTVSGMPLSLLRLQSDADRTPAILDGAVEISGDADVAQDLRAMLDAVEIDWEEQLSYVLGDVIAHQLGRAARATRSWTRYAVDALGQNLSEYVQEEAGLVARRYDVEQFVAGVDQLRMDVDRLDLRVQRLAERLEAEVSGDM
jgi:ubiquinone biosynthesis accessory factor UbiJ